MGTISLTDAVPDTEIQSSLINGNNSVLEGAINGGLEDENVSVGADIDVTKLANGTNGQVLATVTATPTWSNRPRLYAAPNTTLLDIVSTAAETTLFTQSIGASDLGTNRMLRLHLAGDYENSSGTDKTFTFRVKFGGTTFYEDASNSLATSASKRAFQAIIQLANIGATNAQHMFGHVWVGSAPATTGIGDLNNNLHGVDQAIASAATNPAIDTTSAQTLEITWQHSVSAASVQLRRKYAILELLSF